MWLCYGDCRIDDKKMGLVFKQYGIGLVSCGFGEKLVGLVKKLLLNVIDYSVRSSVESIIVS